MKHIVHYLFSDDKEAGQHTELFATEDELKKALEQIVRQSLGKDLDYDYADIKLLLEEGEVYEAFDLWLDTGYRDPLDTYAYGEQEIDLPDAAPPHHPHQIVVTMDGGLIQDIENIPKGVDIVVLDFDTDGVDRSELKDNPFGKGKCFINVWYGENEINALPYKEIPL